MRSSNTESSGSADNAAKKRRKASPPKSGDTAERPIVEDAVDNTVEPEQLSCLHRRELVTGIRKHREEMAQFQEAYATMVARLENVEQRFAALEQNSVDAAEEGAKTRELERTITQLRADLNERDQGALLSDLEIGQLPEMTRWDLEEE